MYPMKAVNIHHHALYKPCDEVAEGESVRDLVAHMFAVVENWGAAGLAANQLGISKRVIVVRAGGFRQAIVNPKIVKKYGGLHTMREGCLSFGTDTALVVRNRQIIVEGFDVDGTPIRFKLKKLPARVVQHEVDHLNGITIL